MAKLSNLNDFNNLRRYYNGAFASDELFFDDGFKGNEPSIPITDSFKIDTGKKVQLF